MERCTIRLTVPAIDVLDFPVARDDQAGRMRDVDRIDAEPVIEPVSFRHHPVFIQQKGVRHGMRLQKLRRLPYARNFSRRDVHQLRSCFLDLGFIGSNSVMRRRQLGHQVPRRNSTISAPRDRKPDKERIPSRFAADSRNSGAREPTTRVSVRSDILFRL